MSTYRTGNHWGVTIVREGNPDPDPRCRGEYHGADGGACGVCGWDSHALDRPADQLVAVVVNGDQELAERICELLNAPTPDVPYASGAREALAEVRRRLDRWSKLADDGERLDPALAYGILRAAAAELGLGEEAPVWPQDRATDITYGSEDAPPSPLSASVSASQPQTQGSPRAELVQRAGEHTEVCR